MKVRLSYMQKKSAIWLGRGGAKALGKRLPTAELVRERNS